MKDTALATNEAAAMATVEKSEFWLKALCSNGDRFLCNSMGKLTETRDDLKLHRDNTTIKSTKACLRPQSLFRRSPATGACGSVNGHTGMMRMQKDDVHEVIPTLLED